jgi:hypothetical protein
MLDFPLDPPLLVKDTPKPRRLRSFAEARGYLDAAMRIGRPPAWRQLWRRFEAVKTEDDGLEAIGALRELLDVEDLLERSALPVVESKEMQSRRK